MPVLLERALREPDPAASQTPAQGSLFDAPPVVREAEDRAGPRARDVLGADEYERLRQAAAVLLDARNDSGAMPFAAWVEACWRRLGGPALYTGLSVANDAESLFQLVERLARRTRDRHGRAGSRHRAAVRRADAAGEDGAVEIMTMHKSKGLQFETVILYGLHCARAATRRRWCASSRTPTGCCSARSSRAPRPRPIPCPATWARARRAARPMRWTGCVCGRHARAQALHLVGHVSVDDAGQAKARQRPACLAACGPG